MWFIFKKSFLVTILIVTSFVLFYSLNFRKSIVSKQVFIYFCDVGQGDATLIQSGNFQMLVDAGPDSSVLTCLEEYMPWGDKKVEIAVLTHADNDHFKGFTSVLSQYLVGEMWITPYSKDSADFVDFKRALKKQKKHATRVKYVNQGDVFIFLDLFRATVLWPKLEDSEVSETVLSDDENLFFLEDEWGNDLSIVLKLDIFDKEVLLTGDIEKQTEQALVRSDLINKVEVLKVAHHGSKTSTTAHFLAKAQPEIAAVSSGIKNQHGHPASEIIASLEEVGTTILRTDQLSTFGLQFEKGKGIKVLKKRKRGVKNRIARYVMFGMFLLKSL